MTLTCGRGQDQTKTGWPFIFIHQINCYVKVFLIANWTSQLKMDRNQFYKNIRQLLTSFTCIIRQINISKLNSMSVTFFSCYKGFIWQLRILYMHATRSDRRAQSFTLYLHNTWGKHCIYNLVSKYTIFVELQPPALLHRIIQINWHLFAMCYSS